MFYKQSIRLLGFLLCQLIAIYGASAQSVLNNGTVTLNGSDNTGSSHQPGLEVLKSTPGVGVVFEAGSTFEHVGQFYVAEDGIWNCNNAGSTDYFGYAPIGIGLSLPYQGIGIKGASVKNGGWGAGRPTFGNLVLNSTGIFPVTAGIYVTKSLAFNANGPDGSNIIITPNINTPTSPKNAVIFESTVNITGANSANYIDGYASVTNVTGTFTLPLGDPLDTESPLHRLTINSSVNGIITARYLHLLQHPTTSLGTGISWVSPIGNWPISAPIGTNVTVDLPALRLSADDAIYLRLVGWNGHQWIDLSGTATPGACVTGNCPLNGTLSEPINKLAIGLSRNPANVANLTVWPNPSQGSLHLTISVDKTINEIQIFNQQGRPILSSPTSAIPSGLDVSVLPAGNYVIEVHTTDGQIFRQHFIRQ